MAKALTVLSVETVEPASRAAGDTRRPVAGAVSRRPAIRLAVLGRPLPQHTAGRASTRSDAIPRSIWRPRAKLASTTLRAVAEGRNPGQERKQARALDADSVEAVAAQFVERHCRKANRPRTAAETERLLRLHVLPRWRGRSVHEITRRDVLDVLDRVVDAGAPIAANRTLSAVRKMFNWCVARDIIATSPCAGVKPPTAERSRDRVLSDPELRAVWSAAERVGCPFGALVELLILTGAAPRRSRWDALVRNRPWTAACGRCRASA